MTTKVSENMNDRFRRLLTAQTPSGTSVSFNIPAGTRRITIMLAEVTLSGGDELSIQIGNGSVETTGYESVSVAARHTTTGAGDYKTSAFTVEGDNFNNGAMGHVLLTAMDAAGQKWVESHSVGATNGSTSKASCGGGYKEISGGELDVLTIKPDSTNTFSGGEINVLCEG